MFTPYTLPLLTGDRKAINRAYRMNEMDMVEHLLTAGALSEDKTAQIQSQATSMVKMVREKRKSAQGVDSFLVQYALTSEEGIALMCLAEALLRIPDKETVDRLIKDKLTAANWGIHRGQSDRFFVNATTFALMLTGKVLAADDAEEGLSKVVLKLIQRSGEGVVRKAVNHAMRIMSKQFVMGRTIEEAIDRARKSEEKGYRYSYDMLGEAALTMEDAKRYLDAYIHAIKAIGESAKSKRSMIERAGVSVKLSALYPRYQEFQRDKAIEAVSQALLTLAVLAKEYDIGLTVDAEESERLDISLDIIENVFSDPKLYGWDGFGIAVQSYQKRAFYVLDWAHHLAKAQKRRMVIRLIKGAYWDSEIKKTQMAGLEDYPVFTRKVYTDVSFQACAKKILTMTDYIYPQFATHNVYSVAMILSMVGDYKNFEFQCLHGMGQELYSHVVEELGIPCRIYAPVGGHADLLPYLVRRLLENGANSSFVNRIADDKAPIETLVVDPHVKAKSLLSKPNLHCPKPQDVFLPLRHNSKGFDFTDRQALHDLQAGYAHMSLTEFKAKPILGENTTNDGPSIEVCSPQQHNGRVGEVQYATLKDVDVALHAGHQAFHAWSRTSVENRAACIEKLAHILEENTPKLMVLAVLEAGKTWNDAIGELREAVDFCYYYANEARRLMTEPMVMHGYTGELNHLSLHPRGLIVCISPWNFPLAIFLGQVVAALVTGNTVIAKPAEQTSLIGYLAVQYMLEAGIPSGVIQYLPGEGEVLGPRLVSDPRVKGVVFTGSTQTATAINRALANRPGEIIPLIAETGGQNAMIVDSSAHIEQVVTDVITSAFGSAGQRCSALRMLYIQEEIYERVVTMLKGAMEEIVVGDPIFLSTDVGPVIDREALYRLETHVQQMTEHYSLIYQVSLTEAQRKIGHFMAPTAIAVKGIEDIPEEVFGPVLHIAPYKRDNIDKVTDAINATGYGLTFGIHSRINRSIHMLRDAVHAGNCYVNRNMIGAVVGLQPFGGQGLSGTGPKAGGPHYLLRFCHERTYTVDTTAAGGNASLMSGGE